jgi:demethylmenaquinone methyltransferase / 2-methoxy-6-polyprenyl-1,4-benzoquinol methylase
MMVKPYEESGSKKEQVEQMFNNIAGKYDFLNHLLSMGIDKLWRKRAIRFLKTMQPKRILDVASGTGDFAIAATKINPDRIDAIDISENMLAIADKKINKRGLDEIIKTKIADAESLPFEDNIFDAITVAFGVRNFENLEKGLSDMNRVLKDTAVVAILEFSMPKNLIVKGFYNFYFTIILPFWGRIISKDKSAYTYLPESVKAFPEREHFIQIMEKCGYKNCSFKKLTFGIACLYIGYK